MQNLDLNGYNILIRTLLKTKEIIFIFFIFLLIPRQVYSDVISDFYDTIRDVV